MISHLVGGGFLVAGRQGLFLTLDPCKITRSIYPDASSFATLIHRSSMLTVHCGQRACFDVDSIFTPLTCLRISCYLLLTRLGQSRVSVASMSRDVLLLVRRRPIFTPSSFSPSPISCSQLVSSLPTIFTVVN